jgi:protein farnesyltransferase subunit beta
MPTPFRWKCQPLLDMPGTSAAGIFDRQDVLRPFHPLFVIPHEAAKNMRDWSEGQRGSWSVDQQP